MLVHKADNWPHAQCTRNAAAVWLTARSPTHCHICACRKAEREEVLNSKASQLALSGKLSQQTC